MIDYNKRLVEVDEILNYLSKENLEKIPEDVRQSIKENKDKEYVWKYDENKPLKYQNVSRDTIAFLSYLNMEYLLNEEQKAFIENMHKMNEKKLEEEKREKYNPDNIFKNSEDLHRDAQNVQDEQEIVMTQYKESIFTKIKNWFKGLFGRK